ncbi:glycosyltransferase [Phycicoccus duodecadis]|uniref:GT2 family glycosyltransferase n=1 Tax=Phycicoccus duodecadis TaxID=173053 RepID=A0A2N3YK65_9MICO|nr:glycosyltransferase [Phycicoccus duodecadis]PKW27178.1 GT2 family glycosyltransferase [Phycicoccus duodecadis]
MSVAVVVVGFGDEPVLAACLEAVRAQLGRGDEVVLVDHGVTRLPDVTGVRVLTMPNGGFGAGCAAGAAATAAEVLVFVNSDAVLRPGALAALAARVADPAVGLAGGLVLLPEEADRPDTVNSAGLPVHLSGLSWCDGYGERLGPAHLRPRRLASVAGALFACRREVWDLLGGMDASYFMYHEDTDLSLRTHLAGLDVVYVPEAVATHAYEFSRNPRKMFHLERNRLLTVIGDYPTHLLVRTLPVLLVLEPLYLVVAVRDGWAREKLRAWGWLLGHAGSVRARRRRVQAAVHAPHALDALVTPSITQTQLDSPGAIGALNGLLRLYWRGARPRATVGGIVPAASGRPDVVVLRTNPKDSSLPRLLTILTTQLRTTALVWDRKGDYRCPVVSPRLTLQRSTRPGEYYRLSTVVKVALLQPWFLWNTLRARPRVVHAMDLDTGIAGLIGARLLRVPFVYQCLDPYAASLPVGWPNGIARVLERIEDAVITAADLFLITDLLRLPQHPGAKPRGIVELPNIPLGGAAPQPFSDDGLIVGYIGSLVPHRSLDVIVDTVGSMAAEGISLVLGGFGPLEEDLRRRAARYPNVTFLGWVDDDVLMSTMSRFDVFVQIEDPDHPAYRWVSPNKVFESMALGRPIVVAEGTLSAQRVVKSRHGVTVSYGARDDLQRVLRDLLHNHDRLRTLGASGRQAFVDEWSPATVCSVVMAAYPVSGAHSSIPDHDLGSAQ